MFYDSPVKQISIMNIGHLGFNEEFQLGNHIESKSHRKAFNHWFYPRLNNSRCYKFPIHFRMAKSRSMPSLRNKVGSEENFNSSVHSKLQVQNGHHVTLQTNAFQNKRKLELFIECTDLVQLDTFSRTDPMCVLYVKKLGQWMEHGRTESIPNSLHPKVFLWEIL